MNNSIIYHKLLDKTYDLTTKMGNTLGSSFRSTDGNLYKILIQTPKYLFVIYFFLLLALWRFISFFEIRLNEILTFIVAGVVIYFLFQKENYEFTK